MFEEHFHKGLWKNVTETGTVLVKWLKKYKLFSKIECILFEHQLRKLSFCLEFFVRNSHNFGLVVVHLLVPITWSKKSAVIQFVSVSRFVIYNWDNSSEMFQNKAVAFSERFPIRYPSALTTGSSVAGCSSSRWPWL